MTQAMSIEALRQHPALQALSSAAQIRLAAQGVVRQFRLGQSLSTADLIPSEILLVLSGQVRVLIQEQSRTVTLEKLGAGAWVGLASLLRAAPCEEVAAASDVTALALPDALILELLSTESSFRHWCTTHLWSAELAALLAPQLAETPRVSPGLRQVTLQALPLARLIEPTAADLAWERRCATGAGAIGPQAATGLRERGLR